MSHHIYELLRLQLRIIDYVIEEISPSLLNIWKIYRFYYVVFVFGKNKVWFFSLGKKFFMVFFSWNF